MSKVTLKDIARTLKLSPSTVSRALSNHPDVDPKTREMVMAIVSKLGYQPDSIAQSLRRQRTKTIGVVVPEIKHEFFSAAISGIEDAAYEAGYTIFVCQSNESYEREVINVKALISNRVAGLLVSISQTTTSDSPFLAAQKKGIPIVFFDRILDDIKANKVKVDDYEGALKAVEYLIRSGCRRIAHLAGPQSLLIGSERLQGYKDALTTCHLPIDDNLIVIGGLHESNGVSGAKQLLELPLPPDAIFAVNDPVAVGAYLHIKEKGLKIPDDIALVGFSNNPTVSLLETPLTTVEQSSYEMGKTAAKLLLEQIESGNNDFVPQTIVMKTQLIVRKSTKPLSS